MIEVESLTKSRGGTVVLDGISLSGREGAVTALVGPSGGGKSTLLRCLIGLETFDAGRVGIAGHTLAAGPQPLGLLERLRRDVGMVFQQFNLFPHLSVIDNVMLAPRVVLRSSPDEARQRAEELLERVGLARFASVRPATLSGGQQQRVAIARALIGHPGVLLLDEPFSALDPFTRASLHELLLDLWRELRPTIVMVTHDIEEAVVLADRIVVMKPKPGRVHEAMAVDLPRPRDRLAPAFDLMKRRVMRAIDRSLGEDGGTGFRASAGSASPWV